MNKTKILISLCMKKFGLDENLKTLEERILIQKKFYLLQQFGVNLGLNYGWYKRGPYCTELTRTIYSQKDEPEDTSKYKLKNDLINKIEEVNNLISNTKMEGLNDQQWSELLASLHFLGKNKILVESDKLSQELTNELIVLKPWYTKLQINKAIDVLKDKQLL